jgi:hypothetical protein
MMPLNGKKLLELPVANERLRADILTILNHLNAKPEVSLSIAMDCAFRVYRELARRAVGSITRWDSALSNGINQREYPEKGATMTKRGKEQRPARTGR